MSLVGNDCVVKNEQGQRIQANITSDRWPLVPDIGPDFQGALQGNPGDKGWGFWNAEEGGMRLKIEAPGYVDEAVLTTAPVQVRVMLKRAPIERLHVEGEKFVTASGKPYVWAHVTLMRAYQRFLNGEDLRPVFQQALELGANGIRVLGMFGWDDGNGPLIPQQHGETYYSSIGAFAELTAEYGFQIQWVVFADTRLVMGNQQEQLKHFNRVVETVRPHANINIELVNENNSNQNGIDIAAFPRPQGICSSAGSNGAGSNPPGPYWDYSDLHAERREDRIALTTTTVWFAINGYSEGNDSFPGTKRATVNSEPYGFDEVNDPGRRTNDPAIAYLMGVGCKYGAGGTAHSTDGIQAVLLRPLQVECVKQFLAGLQGT